MIYCVLIHGTFSLRRWARDPNGPMRTAIAARIPTARFEPFEWNGWHSQSARNRAAKRLRALLADLKRNHQKIVVIGHSHGGNVGLQAIQDFGYPTDDSLTLITLATPFLYARSASETRNLRAVVAGALALVFLTSVGIISIRMDFWALSTIATFAMAVVAFAGAVVTSQSWLPLIISRVASHSVRRRQTYERVALLYPVRMLVAYSPHQDEVTNAFNSIRRCSLGIARTAHHVRSRANVEDQRWLARSPNRVPAICIGTAGLLTFLNMLVKPDAYRMWLVVVAILFVLAGLCVFIGNYIWPSLLGLAALVFQFVNGLSKVVYSSAKSGFSLDFLFMSVRTKAIPSNPHQYHVDMLRLEANDSRHALWRRLLDRLTFANHRKIVSDKRAAAGIAEWIEEEGMPAAD
jgi:PGAP1-like protein